MNSLKIAAALRVLALAFESDEDGNQAAAPTAEPQKRGRGRPAKGEDVAAPVAAPAVQGSPAASVPEVDPFETPAPIPAVLTASLDEVRKALTDLKAAASQEKALAVLKSAGGADNLAGLAADKYGVVVAAVNVQLRIIEAAKPAPVAEVDPFEVSTTAAVPVAKPATLEDVKAIAVAAGKRTSQDAVQKVVMAHGGKAVLPTGGEGPSLKALPEAQYAAVIAAINALPTTK